MAFVGPVWYLKQFASQISDLDKPFCQVCKAMQIKRISTREATECFTESMRVWYTCGTIFGKVSPFSGYFQHFFWILDALVDVLGISNCRAILIYSTASAHVRSRVFPPLQILTNDKRGLRSSSTTDEKKLEIDDHVYKSKFILKSKEIDKVNH